MERRCECEHGEASHGPRPPYYGAAESEPRDHSCYFCLCAAFAPHAEQGAAVRPLKADEYAARREALGLPRMRVL